VRRPSIGEPVNLYSFEAEARRPSSSNATGAPDLGGGPAAVVPPEDLRAIHRIPVRLRVSQRGQSAPLGRTRDLSLQGVFVETDAPFGVGAVIPLSLELVPDEAPLALMAEVVRQSPGGMGLRFIKADRGSERRLKRWIVEFTSVQGTRRQAEQLHDPTRTVEPWRAPARIGELLGELLDAGERVILVPPERAARDHARLTAFGEHEVAFTVAGASTLLVGEEVFGLVNHGFVSWSFTVRVLEVDGIHVRCERPAQIVYSERRAGQRAQAPADAVLRWPTPWHPEGCLSYPVLERSADGLSFKIAAGACLVAPGSALEGATLLFDGREEVLHRAEVRHITPLDGEPDGSWLRVGVSHGFARRILDAEEHTAPRGAHGPGPFSWLTRRLASLRTFVSYGFHKGRHRFGQLEAASRRVTVPRGDLPLVGLLDQTEASDERVRCPLVIVVPGFAGRKEQMSYLAHTLVDGFQRQHRDIAVLRIDGSNNLGESARDPECEGEGRQALHYTLSGLVEDLLASLRWARSNPFVDPSHIVVVSVSMASVGVRHALTLPETRDVGLWVSYMGAADAIDAIRNVSGNIDLNAYWERGDRLGIVSLNGVLTDGDRFWADMMSLGIGHLAQAREEMTRVRADVVWLRGIHDAWMDPRRVNALISAPAEARRELIEVDSGHIPKTGDEAISQFVKVTQRVWQHVHHGQLPPFRPSLGRLEVARQAEWERIKRRSLGDSRRWWQDYLLSGDGLGFDILEHSPHYAGFMDLQAAALAPSGADVLDLGAGTGNLTRRLLAAGAERVVAVDLVPEALERLSAKGQGDARLTTRRADLDGAPRILLRRLVRGDVLDLRQLASRLAGVPRDALEHLLKVPDEDVRAAIVGRTVDVRAAAEHARLPANAAALLGDLHRLARVARGLDDESTLDLAVLPQSVLSGPPGLPFPDESFDAVGMSLLLSYLAHPDDLLAEAWRVLRPGGRLVVSSMIEDSDSGKLYLELVAHFEAMPEDACVEGAPRSALLAAARAFVDHASELYRLEEEGLFKFFGPKTLSSLALRRGFVSPRLERAFGSPPQAVVLTCLKPSTG